VAAEGQLRGACLLGEMPQMFTQLPFPKASLAVLEAFSIIAGIPIDLGGLAEQAKEVEQKLGELLEKVQEVIEDQREQAPDEEEAVQLEPPGEEGPGPDETEHIERLFRQATKDRSQAYELKRELDRLNLYKDYEDRFLDLFKKPE
jgi:hypothetical protein